MHPETARRGRLLSVALVFLGLDMPPAAQPSGLRALLACLDTWHVIGLIAHGLARRFRLPLAECGRLCHVEKAEGRGRLPPEAVDVT